MDGIYESPDLDALAALDRRVWAIAGNYPPKSWMPPTEKPGEGEALDVVIIGGGMGSLAACSRYSVSVSEISAF